MPRTLKTISLLAEVDEDVYERMRSLISSNQTLDQDKLITAALLMYLPHAEAIATKVEEVA